MRARNVPGQGPKGGLEWDPDWEGCVLPAKCPVCEKCRRVVTGPYASEKCIYGGPFTGYLDLSNG